MSSAPTAGAASGTKGSKWKPEEDADNPLYKEDNFRMYCLKVLPCSKRYCHDWTTCPFAHSAEKAKRRDPRVYNYTGVACPEMKKNMACPRGDQCPFAHNVFEYWLHHSRYRTQLCNDGVGCKRKICFFAHTLDELRVSSVKVQPPTEADCINPFAPSPTQGSSKPGRKSLQQQGAGSMPPSLPGAIGSDAFNLAELQQLSQLQAHLRGDNGMGMNAQRSYSMPTGQDQASVEQLIHLMALAQGQTGAPGSGTADHLQMVALQALLASQQQQQQAHAAAAAMLQAQQVASLLGQMHGVGAAAAALQELITADPAAAAAAAAILNNQAGMGFHGQVDPFAQQNVSSLQPAHTAPPELWNQPMQDQQGTGRGLPRVPSALTAAMAAAAQQEQRQQQAAEDLARQLSGLSTSTMTSMGPFGNSAFSDAPNSARSYGSGSVGNAAFRRQVTAPPASLNALAAANAQHSYDASCFPPVAMSANERHSFSLASAPTKPGMLAGSLGHGPVASPRTLRSNSGTNGMPIPGFQRTSPISVSALGDGYTTATGNSYFSNSLSSSQEDGSDLASLHH